MLENKYQAKLIKKIKRLLPGCMVLKNDTDYQQGIPDLLVLFGSAWAALEVKKSYEDRQKPEPNQEWYVDTMDLMSFGAFIYPENEEDILNDLQRALKPYGAARLSERQ